MSTDEYDWIFDFTLQFLESEKFDAAVMDFVDERCHAFDQEEENKLIYTSIHKEFCEHVEVLIQSNLGELGITTDIFLESCKKARNSRDINATVFERLIAMDDFQTFKKIMATRNTELQVESMSYLQVDKKSSRSSKSHLGVAGAKDTDNEPVVKFSSRLMDPDELKRQKELEDEFLASLENMPEEEVGCGGVLVCHRHCLLLYLIL
jgi:hypothetical protein